ncbi:MAG: hypothetical protein ACJASV_003070 [Pseudorhodobacter sp.]|jgi:hypothetical protein
MRSAPLFLTQARKLAVLACLGALLSACVPQGADLPTRATLPPLPRIDGTPAASPASEALRSYYAGLQAGLLSRGLMRTDTGSQDAPFTARMLANNFIRIALFDEFDSSTGNSIARTTESRLRRWDKPVRVGLNFGASVGQPRRDSERVRVASLLARLSQLTGLSIRLVDSQVNFYVYIVNEDERLALGPSVKANIPDLSNRDIASLLNMPSSTYCQVSAMVDRDTSLYHRSFAVIRAEHPDLLHLSCLHEEISQGLGLPNDSPTARPSIFNDDQEFALLTPMDELMLKMLYDPRLTPGMTVPEARPIVERIAEELIGGGA